MIMANEHSLLQLFAEVVPAEWRTWQEGQKRTQIYTLPVVVAMMLLQRLNERGTQQEAVHQVAAGRLDHLLAVCKRVQEEKDLAEHRRLRSSLWANRGRGDRESL